MGTLRQLQEPELGGGPHSLLDINSPGLAVEGLTEVFMSSGSVGDVWSDDRRERTVAAVSVGIHRAAAVDSAPS